jgi:hypothetical protein
VSAALDLPLDPLGSYRADRASQAEPGWVASRHLRSASDALALALLSLGGSTDETRSEKLHRAAHARSFLAEAVTSLSRARIYVRGVRTHSLAVVMASERNIDRELDRLHQIATRLLWQNHAYLPARTEAKPLSSEEEAQLAVMVHYLSRSAKIGRVMRYRWAMAGLLVGAACYVAGFSVAAGVLASAGLFAALWHTLRNRRRSAVAALVGR